MDYSKRDAKAYSRQHMRGIWAAAATPFTPGDLRIDEAGLRRNIRHWLDDLALGNGIRHPVGAEEIIPAVENVAAEPALKKGVVSSSAPRTADRPRSKSKPRVAEVVQDEIPAAPESPAPMMATRDAFCAVRPDFR